MDPQITYSILMEEYKVCTTRADQYATFIWTLFTALLSLSAGGLLLVGQKYIEVLITIQDPKYTTSALFMTIIVSEFIGGAAIFIFHWWNRVANVWNRHIKVWYNRMIEIESQLDMWANRDIDLLDNKEKVENKDLSTEVEYRLMWLNRGIGKNFPKNVKGEGISGLRNKIVNYSSMAWFFLLILEIGGAISTIWSVISKINFIDLIWIQDAMSIVFFIVFIIIFLVSWVRNEKVHEEKTKDFSI